MSDGLIARLERGAQGGQDIVLLDGSAPESVSWAALVDEACRMAAALQSRGVAPGDRVAVVGSTSRSLVTALEACWLTGAAVIVPPLRTRLEAEQEFRSRTVERLTVGEVSATLCDPELAELCTTETLPAPLTLPDLVVAASATPVGRYERPPDDPERTAILQFTSGSTADPKGVVIPARCLLDNLDAVVDRAPLDADDVVVSWLPLYHDMGLVYNLSLAMTTGVRFVLAPPSRFITSPGLWMEWMDFFGGTWTIGPNFALVMAARLLKKAPAVNLSRCRRLGSGSEPVDPDIMDALAAAGQGNGLDPGSLYAGYGMAEATVAVSFAAPGRGFAADVVDGDLLEREGVAEQRSPSDPVARRLARCGPPLRGFELRIAEPETGAVLPDRTVGEIELRGPSVVPGYFRRPDATAAAFRTERWMRTGDLGYLTNGELVVCGRLKDMIIVGGRNVFPEDLERAAQQVEGVRAGNVIAFGVSRGRKGDAVVVVAELKTGDAVKARDELSRVMGESCGVRLDDVVLVVPGSLPKTSSGKLRRGACRSRYQAGELERL